jgi:NAD(P)-dependent dehydrogenase (short-subunit alcohol dehydrogenase family)
MNWHPKHCAVIGANGGIGAAFISHLLTNDSVESIHCCSRSGISQFTNGKAINHILDYDNPESIAAAAAEIKSAGPLDLAIVATRRVLVLKKAYGSLIQKISRALIKSMPSAPRWSLNRLCH